MNEKPKNELMFVQNEILLDIKKVENKLESKIFKVSSSFDDLQEKINKKIENIENELEILIEKTDTLKEGDLFEKQIESRMNLLNKRIDEYISRIDSKVIVLQNTLKDSCYKYDKIFNNNFVVPGLIGERCQYPNLQTFLENANKKINESLRMKEQQNFNFKNYKEKLEGIIQKNRTQIQAFEKNIDNLSKENDNQCQGRYAIIGEKLNKLKLENEKYSIELVNKCNNLEEKWTKDEEALNNSLKQCKEELKTYSNMFNDMKEQIKVFEEQYYNFQENIKMFNGLNKNVQDIQNSINKYDLKFNQINNKLLVIKLK
jgi:chromosome segregation ATPase